MMHKAGLEYLRQVKWAILVGDGRISVIPEDQQTAAQRSSITRVEENLAG